MLVQLADLLRCPAGHQESPLVLAVDEWRDGQVATGTLGCPVCRASYAIREGVAEFAPGGVARPVDRATRPTDMTEAAWRLAAQLDLLSPGPPVLLAGAYTQMAGELARIAAAACVCIDDVPLPGASTLRVGDRIPLATGSVRGAAVGRGRASPGFLAEVARVTAAGGRIVAPADIPAPDGVTVFVADEAEWVGRVERVQGLVSLARTRRP